MTAVVGRERELALAATFLEAAKVRFAVLLLEGEAGIGKTTVWQEAARRAAEDGFHVLSCRPAEAEAKFALSAVTDLLEGVDDETLSRLPDPQRRALEVALLRREHRGAPLDPRTLGTSLRSLLAELSKERPLLVAVDDVQWLDSASAAVLGFVLRRQAMTRSGWLFSRRMGEPTQLEAGKLAPPESLGRAAIGPLTLAALHHALRDQLGEALPRGHLVRVHQASGGNPFYALELARELRRTRTTPSDGALPVPDDLRDLLAQRLRRLSQPTRDALLTAAALSDPTTSLVDEQALATAEEADIVRIDERGRIAFRHPLYASAVYDSASRARRRVTHERLAEIVVDDEERARHVALAAAGPTEAAAAELDRAARRAADRGAPHAAAELTDMAVRLTPPDQVVAARRRRLAEARYLFVAGDPSRARRTCEELLAEVEAEPIRAEVLMLLAEATEDDLAATLAVGEEALTAADDDPALGARAHDLVGRVLIIRGELERARAQYRSGLELAERAGDRELCALVIGHAAHTESLLGRYTPGLLDRGVRLEREGAIVLDYGPTFASGLRAMYADRLDDSRMLLHEVRGAAIDAGAEHPHANVLLHLAELECRAGDLDSADRFAAEALERAEQVGLEHSQAGSLYIRALIAAVRGDVGRTRQLAGRGLELVHGGGIFFVQLESVLGFLELSLGDAAAAAEHLRGLPPLLDRMGYGEPSVNRVLPNAIEALVQLGELDEAMPLVDKLEERGRSLDSPWSLSTGARCRGLLLGAAGDLGGALDAFDRALLAHRRMPGPFEQGRTLLAKGMVERRDRKRARAKGSFEEALEIFEAIGAALWAGRAQQELGRVGLRRAAGDELTESELRVAELAARGLTNREVAAALFMSPKTVEANLSRIYRKLGIGSRAELGARMAEVVQP